MDEPQQGDRTPDWVCLWAPTGIVLVVGIAVLVAMPRLAQASIVLVVSLGGQMLQVASTKHRTREGDASIKRLERTVERLQDALRDAQETAQTEAKSLQALIGYLTTKVGGGDQLGPGTVGGLPSKAPGNDRGDG